MNYTTVQNQMAYHDKGGREERNGQKCGRGGGSNRRGREGREREREEQNGGVKRERN